VKKKKNFTEREGPTVVKEGIFGRISGREGARKSNVL